MDVGSLNRRMVNRPAINKKHLASNGAYVATAVTIQELSDHGAFPRKGLPDIINIGDHIGNVPFSSLGSAFTTYAVLQIAQHLAQHRNAYTPNRSRAAIAGAAIGAGVGLPLNAFFETRTGIRLNEKTVGWYINESGINGGSLVDLAYGALAATATGVMAGWTHASRRSPARISRLAIDSISRT